MKGWIALFGGFLTTIIALSVILSWKFDASMGKAVQDIRTETESKYVMKEIYRMQIDTIESQLKAIAKAVGARTR